MNTTLYKIKVVLIRTSFMFPIINGIIIGRVSLSLITLITIFLTFSNQVLAVDHDPSRTSGMRFN